MLYDYLIVGSGFFGSICAHELNKHGFKCLVLEKRNHIGGNCFTSEKDSIHIHEYGPHIFHTSNEKIWNWINQFVKFNNFIYSPVANYKGETYSLPFSMWTFSKLWDIKFPYEAQEIIKNQSLNIDYPTNLEEQALKMVGKDVYEKLIKGYTEKQWRKSATELPKEIIQRLPLRFTYDNNYFTDKYQGIPIGGYTQIFEKLLQNVEVILNTDFLSNKSHWESVSKKIIYTGPIDRYFNYVHGHLEYKTTTFKHELKEIENYQGTAVMNYTDRETPYTRIIEHKHFEKSQVPVSWITHEYPTEYVPDITDPYYPVNDSENNLKCSKYKDLSKNIKNTIFGGRLAEYKYYDMHQVIDSALKIIDVEINNSHLQY